ncbi:tail fiber assembly protein [Providencia rettgeri]|nr:tail fiber assembly protein [Providencia rettgeri]
MKNYNLNITEGKFGEDGYVSMSGWIKVYPAHWDTREYMGATMEYVSIGGGLSSCTYIDPPALPEKQGIAIIRSEDEKTWIHVADHRGKVAFSTENRQPVNIDFIGELPQSLTLFEPQTDFDKWDGKKWITDIDARRASNILAAESKKSELLQEATMQIAYLQDAVDMSIALEEEISLLQQWKEYRIKLSRIDTSISLNIEWPTFQNK